MGTIAYGEFISWESLQENTLFTENGLKYAAELTEIPEDVQQLESSQGDGVDFDLKSTQFSADETAKELQDLFASQTGPYARYFRFRQNALEKLWLKRDELKNNSLSRSCETTNSKLAELETTLNIVSKQKIGFSSRISLLLLIPLIKSHCKIDPSLAEHSGQVLFQCLKECPPNSLGDEPLSCITGLADLLSSWLPCNADEDVAVLNNEETSACSSKQEEIQVKKAFVQSETVVGCLLSLACARYVDTLQIN